MKDYSKIEEYNRPGGAYNRGGVDAWYRRAKNPHYYQDNNLSGRGRINRFQMTEDEIAAYYQGHLDGILLGEYK